MIKVQRGDELLGKTIYELLSPLLSLQDQNVQATFMAALGDILVKLPSKCSDATQANLLGVLESFIYSDSASETLKFGASKCLSSVLVKHASADKLLVYLKKSLEPALMSYDSDTKAVSKLETIHLLGRRVEIKEFPHMEFGLHTFSNKWRRECGSFFRPPQL